MRFISSAATCSVYLLICDSFSIALFSISFPFPNHRQGSTRFLPPYPILVVFRYCSLLFFFFSGKSLNERVVFVLFYHFPGACCIGFWVVKMLLDCFAFNSWEFRFDRTPGQARSRLSLATVHFLGSVFSFVF